MIPLSRKTRQTPSRHRYWRRRYRWPQGQCRRGATAVEMGFVLIVFLTLVLGMLDLGMAVFRYHVLAEVARVGARQAIVHGEMASELGPWGPASYEGPAAGSHTVSETLQSSLPGLDLSGITLKAEWLDGNNLLEDRVRVTASMPYTPLMGFIFGSNTIPLAGSSTMPIAH